MVIATSCAREHHTVGMECGGCDSGAAALVKEGGIRFNAGELSAMEVEDLYGVVFGAAVI